MRLYCYTYNADQIMKAGYLSAAVNPNPEQLKVYSSQAGSDDLDDIKKYLERTLPGRTRAICCLTEMAPIEAYEHPYLDYLVHHASVISFELDELLVNNLVDCIYCKDNSQTAKTDICFENIYKVSNIDVTPLDWHNCLEKYGSPWNMLRHYLLVLTQGYIPPQFLCLEK